MKRIALAIALLSVAFASLLYASQPALTIYDQNFAVVRDTVPLDLKQGVNNARLLKLQPISNRIR